MRKFHVKHHIPKGGGGSLISSSDSSISVTQSLLAALPSFSLVWLVPASGFSTSSDWWEPLHASKRVPSFILSGMIASYLPTTSSTFSDPCFYSFEKTILSLSKHFQYIHENHYMHHSYPCFKIHLSYHFIPLLLYCPFFGNLNQDLLLPSSCRMPGSLQVQLAHIPYVWNLCTSIMKGFTKNQMSNS